MKYLFQDAEELPLLAILRGVRREEVSPISDILLRVGLPAVEVTLNTPSAERRIEEFKARLQGKMSVGAGTVLDLAGLHSALRAGAEFIVSPVCLLDVAAECQRLKVPYFPGALTPQEVWQAWSCGAEMVKIFPAGSMGPSYFKELKGPFDQIKLMAVGGVNADNVSDYLRCGADALACGASVFRRNWLEAEQYDLLLSELQKLAKAITSFNR